MRRRRGREGKEKGGEDEYEVELEKKRGGRRRKGGSRQQEGNTLTGS